MQSRRCRKRATISRIPCWAHACAAVLAVEGKSAHAIFGSPDDLKFRSSMTLFDLALPNDIFRTALDKYFDGEADPLTLQKLR